MEELITIIVPIYNVEQYLPKCIDSIINQTYQNLEIILVDDGSTDLSGDICDYYSEIDSRVEVIHQANSGVSVSRNVGISLSKGKYLTFVDSDDYIFENYISCLYYMIKHYNADTSIASWKKVNDIYISTKSKKKIVQVMDDKRILSMMLLQHGVCGNVWGVLSKRELWDENAFPIGKSHAEDSFTIANVFLKSKVNVLSNEILYCYRTREGSIQNSEYSDNKMEELEMISEMNKLILNRYPEMYELTINRLVSSAFHVLFFMNQKQKKEQNGKIIVSLIKKYRGQMIFGKNVNRKVRLGCVCSYLGLGFTQRVYQALRMRGKINI